MAVAGKVAITPKGEWNANTAYTKLDLVFYDNSSYVAIQPSPGVTPTNTTYWMLVLQSAGETDLEGIINGTTQVGNAKTLDGHEAEYFAPLESETLTTSILEKALTLSQGTYEYSLGGGSYTGTDLPSSNYKYGKATVRTKGGSSTITVILWGVLASGNVIPPVFNLYNGGTWSGWQTFATTADLAKYLPLTGGTVNGNVTVKADDTSQRIHALQNSLRRVFQTIAPSGNYNLYDGTNSKPIIVSTLDGTNTFNGTASGNLLLSGGGIVAKNGTKVMGIHNTNSTYTLFEFYGQNAELGSIGFDGVDNLVFRTVASGTKNILHTGNKPTGTYTGNGDANWRAIDTGGAIGEAVVIVSEKGVGIVTAKGVIGKDSNTNIIGISSADCFYDSTNHRIAIMSANDILNASGVTYKWSVL